MIKCSRCNVKPGEKDIIGWKCNSCGKAFKVSELKLHSILMKKTENPEKSYINCPSCKNSLDDGNECIVWKCSCGNKNMGKLMDFEEEVEDIPKNNLIKCPECGKEISSKAKRCVHCGKELAEDWNNTGVCVDCGRELPLDARECPFCGCPVECQSTFQNRNRVKMNINVNKIAILVILVIVLCAIGIAIYNIKVVRPQKIEVQNREIYEEAVDLLERGKYEEGDELLESIESYKDVAKIREELKYESCAYSAVNAIKKILKNPDSISVYDVNFYNGRESSKENSYNSYENRDELVDEEHPYIIIHLGAQNGFGGNAESYASCIYNKKEDQYQLDTYTHELDVEELDEDDDDFLMYLLGATIISGYYDDGIEVGTMNMDRFKIVLKNDAYSTIKIIE